jgi:hypothetical protein
VWKGTSFVPNSPEAPKKRTHGWSTTRPDWVVVLVSTPHQPAIPPPARLLAFATEYRIGTSRAKAPAGLLVAQLQNNGQDDHDLAVRTARGQIVAKTKIVHHGGLGQLRVRLKPGRYQLVCTLADHEARGMRAVLVVRARKET